jgi:hypothetical protein
MCRPSVIVRSRDEVYQVAACLDSAFQVPVWRLKLSGWEASLE